MSLFRTFSHGIARKLGYLVAVVLFGLAAALFSGKASAQTVVTHADEGKALVAAQAEVSQLPINRGNGTQLQSCEGINKGVTVRKLNGDRYVVFAGYQEIANPSSVSGSCWEAYETYPAQFKVHKWLASCATRSNLEGGYVRGNTAPDTACHEGCQFTKQPGPRVTIDFGALGEGWTQSVAGYAPTGLVCSQETSIPNNDEDCLPIAGQTVCKREDGKLCYSASTGRRICWSQGETGQQTDGSDVQVRNVGTQPQPPNIGQPTQPSAQPPITTNVTNVTNNVTTNNSFTTSNHSTTSGGPAGGTNQGEATNPDGTGTGTGGTTGGTGTGTDMTATNAKLDGIKGTLDGIKEWWDSLGTEAGTLDDSPGDDVEAGDAWQEGDAQGDLDATGYGWGNTCPTPPQIDIPGGGQLDWSALCTWAGYFGTLILAAGYVQAAFVIGRA